MVTDDAAIIVVNSIYIAVHILLVLYHVYGLPYHTLSGTMLHNVMYCG